MFTIITLCQLHYKPAIVLYIQTSESVDINQKNTLTQLYQ